jgi:hypothetical protein
MSRSSLDSWWDRYVAQRRNALTKQYPLPSDGASWACMDIFFGVVGLSNPRHRITTVARQPVVDKFLELWPKIKPTYELT